MTSKTETNTMGEIVDLKGQPPAHPESDLELVADCCRYQEGILTEAAVKKRHHYTDDVWEKLGDNEALLEAVAEEKTRRIRTGLQKRERSQHLITKAPAILDSIACDTTASPRHRVDAIKVLDDFATPPQETTAAAAERFVITINLGNDHIEHYDKSITIDANDGSDIAAPAKKPARTIEHEPTEELQTEPPLTAAKQAAMDAFLAMEE